jgi:hypothetical protein
MSSWQAAVYSPRWAIRAIPRENGVPLADVDLQAAAVPLPASLVAHPGTVEVRILVALGHGALELVPLDRVGLLDAGGWADYSRAISAATDWLDIERAKVKPDPWKPLALEPAP